MYTAVMGIDQVFVNLAIAMFLGMVIGLERFVAGKTAGMRTYTLVSLGSALFVTISQIVAAQFSINQTFDPLRVAAQVVAAAGFLGVGAIFHRNNQVSGVTTASGLWVAAGIGLAAGFGLYEIAIMVTVLTLFIFIALWFIERQISKISARSNKNFNLSEQHPELEE
ncbi:MAG TPA: MgtC/SapB family protein [Candidatus Paceibacterota bacterium]|nr:MgtC/SapB family protein [Candidatus Paceibacterota bacterium]